MLYLILVFGVWLLPWTDGAIKGPLLLPNESTR